MVFCSVFSEDGLRLVLLACGGWLDMCFLKRMVFGLACRFPVVSVLGFGVVWV